MQIRVSPEININLKVSDHEMELLQYAAEQNEKTVSTMLSEIINDSVATHIQTIYQLNGLVVANNNVFATV